MVLGAMGEFFRKFIGIIYLSEDKSKVIISHNTFMGSRRDVWMNISDIVPISDTPENAKEELIWKIYIDEKEQKSFYICTKFGGIVNPRLFADIFGDDFQFNKKK